MLVKRMLQRTPQKRQLQKVRSTNRQHPLKPSHRVTRIQGARQVVVWHQSHTILGLRVEEMPVGLPASLHQTHKPAARETISWSLTQRYSSDNIQLLKEHFAFWVVLAHTKLLLNGRKPENDSLLRLIKKNTKAIIINHKETRMVKDGED